MITHTIMYRILSFRTIMPIYTGRGQCRSRKIIKDYDNRLFKGQHGQTEPG